MTKRKETLFGVILLTLVFLGFSVFFLFQTFSESTASAPPPRIQPQWYTVETASHDYPASEAADPNFVYMPVQCNPADLTHQYLILERSRCSK
jgi:hypothetical protein